MKREAVILKLSSDGKRAICIDKQNAEELLAYIRQDDRHRKKFRFICDIILQGLRNSELYTKERISNASKSVTAMKFFKGQENDRIYCLEQRTPEKLYVIICVELVKKKESKKLTKRLRSIINKIARYEYTFIED